MLIELGYFLKVHKLIDVTSILNSIQILLIVMNVSCKDGILFYFNAKLVIFNSQYLILINVENFVFLIWKLK